MVDFAIGQGVAFRDRQRIWGGQIRRVSGPLAANTNITLTHDLRSTPRVVDMLDAGASARSQPSRSGTGYNAKQVVFQIANAVAGGDYGVFFIY